MINDYLPKTKVYFCSKRLSLYYEKALKYLKEGFLFIENLNSELNSEENFKLMIKGETIYNQVSCMVLV